MPGAQAPGRPREARYALIPHNDVSRTTPAEHNNNNNNNRHEKPER